MLLDDSSAYLGGRNRGSSSLTIYELSKSSTSSGRQKRSLHTVTSKELHIKLLNRPGSSGLIGAIVSGVCSCLTYSTLSPVGVVSPLFLRLKKLNSPPLFFDRDLTEKLDLVDLTERTDARLFERLNDLTLLRILGVILFDRDRFLLNERLSDLSDFDLFMPDGLREFPDESLLLRSRERPRAGAFNMEVSFIFFMKVSLRLNLREASIPLVSEA